MTIAEKLMTAEEFAKLPEGETKLELVRGRVVESMPTGGVHGDVVMELGARLRIWAKQGSHGHVASESGFILALEPDTTRAPDLFFIKAQRVVEAGGIPEAFWKIAPDLEVEVVSPSETAQEIQEKVRDYLLAGTPLVWVIYPRTRTVVEHTPDGLARTRTETDTLENADVLPGFSCVVRELFQ
jgi:Uma2 family endonuclease